MKINDVEFVVGDRYLVDDQEMVLSEIGDATTECNAYVVFEGEDGTWELWYGSTEYYKKEGWHGVDGEGPEDDDGATIVSVRTIEGN